MYCSEEIVWYINHCVENGRSRKHNWRTVPRWCANDTKLWRASTTAASRADPRPLTWSDNTIFTLLNENGNTSAFRLTLEKRGNLEVIARSGACYRPISFISASTRGDSIVYRLRMTMKRCLLSGSNPPRRSTSAPHQCPSCQAHSSSRESTPSHTRGLPHSQ